MKETIFFATFNSVVGTQIHNHDRREYFQSEKTLKEFHDWLESHRVNIESIYYGSTVITDVQFIKLGY